MKTERAKAEAEAAEREKQRAIDAEREKARLDAEAIENKRIADEKRKADAAAARLADLEHRKKINNEAVAGLVEGGFSEDDAKKIIALIFNGKVLHVSIQY